MHALEDPWILYAKSLVDNAGQPAIVAGEEEITYNRLHSGAVALSQKLNENAAPQSSISVLLGMLPEFVAADLAILRSNMVKVPLNPMLSATEMSYIIEHSESTVLLTSSALDASYVDKVEAIKGECPDLTIIDVDLATLTTDQPLDISGQPARSTDRAAIYYTGGTTGRPKGVVHSRASVAVNIIAHVLEAEVTASDTLLLSTSLSHSAGAFAGAAIARGAKTVLLDKFSPQSFSDTGTRHAATFAMVVPTMLYRLLDFHAAGGQLPTLKTLVYGSAPVTPSRLKEAIDVFGPILIQLFGQTECPNWGTVLSKKDHALGLQEPAILSSCGKRSLFSDVKVIDEDGHQLGPDKTGEICLSAPFNMDEYLKNPDATTDTKIDGWIHTRDIGQWDERGYLYIKDRKADMIITGGYNVYCSEVEAEIQKIPGVAQVAVIGVPDEDWGEAVCAVVVPAPNSHITEADILSQARDLLGSYKRPKTIQIVDAMPLTPFGKADKKALRAPFWAGRERAI
ncbi:AMP-binding protein [Arthrobacter sp. FW305-123]|nr:AMP-binding protein [Arthrobacter sp. FW305-123]